MDIIKISLFIGVVTYTVLFVVVISCQTILGTFAKFILNAITIVAKIETVNSSGQLYIALVKVQYRRRVI